MENKKILKLGLITAVFNFMILVSTSYAEVEPAAPEAVHAEGRIPASLTKEYPKEKNKSFEAQGFGEDYPEPKKLRAPASNKREKKEEEKEVMTVKTPDELSNELQLQRRVDVFYEGRVRLKNGAAIWATEDSGMTSPKLEITTQDEVDVKNDSIKFRVYTNYLPFIKKWELRVFKKEKLKSEIDVKTITGLPEDLYEVEYSYKEGEYKEGDVLYYQLKVFESDKVFDVIKTKKITFITRPEGTVETDALADSDLIKQIWGQSSIEKQNIPIRGSRVRIVGNNIPKGHFISYRGQSISVNEYGKFLVEEHFPPGKHRILIDIQDKEKSENLRVPFNIDVTGKYFFMVGIADMRIGENSLSEKIAGLSGDDDYDGNVFVDGRFAYFLKGKVKGKYLITSQLDTTEGNIEDIFKGLHRKNSEALFRRLDPDRYYPVYGDNSSTTEEAPTLGKFYVKVEVDQSYAMWGNANSDLTSTLFSQYNRTLYGGHVKYKSKDQTKFGEQKTQITGFVSEPETLFGHNEFLGTGGRLYILRHNDVVQGSEKVAIEIRDRDSGLMKEQIALKPYQDYEFDYLAGRIVLTQPLTTFVMQESDEVIDPNGIGNNKYYLVADYEYSDTGQSLDSLTYGGRVQRWMNDYVSLGGTYVEEDRSTSKYSLTGVDTTFRLGRESFIKAESSTTKDVQTGSNYESTDGGLSFISKPATSGAVKKANAWGVESQLFLNDFLESKTEGVMSTWYRSYEAGFSTARRQAQNDLQEYGYDLELNINARDVIKSKMTISEEENGFDKSTVGISYGRKLKKGSVASIEYRMDTIDSVSAPKKEGQLVGLKYSKRINKSMNAYLKGQTTVNDKGGYEKNDRVAIGSKFRIGNKWDGTAEYSDGDRGDAVVAGLGYNVTDSYKVYANLDKSVDNASGPVTNGITIGQRKSFKNGVRLTAENQFEETGDAAGINQLYGLDYSLNKVMALTFSYQMGDLENDVTGEVTSKSAVSAGVVYTKDTDVTASSKASLVKNKGAINTEQILLTNSLKFKVGPSNTWFFEADYSLSEDPTAPEEALARYIEGNIGYSFRPVMNDRWNVFARYTYLYDLDSKAQENARNDQKVHIGSIEASYDLTRRWVLGARFAQKVGSERVNRDTGLWIDTTLTFSQMRLRYHLIKKWDGLFEYRMVNVKESEDTQSGFLIGLDYHLGGNFKVGAGYNFTKFNDDLTNFSFNNTGWFINIVGKM